MNQLVQSAERTAPVPPKVVSPNPIDGRIAVRVIPGKLRAAQTEAVTTHSFLVTPLDQSGQALADSQIFTVAYKNQQDVLDGVLFFRGHDSKVRLCASRSLWPVLTAREQLGAPRHPAAEEGMLLGLPGSFIRRSLNDTLRNIAAERLGVSVIGEPFILGGASVVLPNSPEVAFPRAIEIAAVPEGRLAVLGTQFNRSRETFALSLQEITNRALSPHGPDIFCMRLLERSLRLAETFKEELQLPEHLSLEHGQVYHREQVSDHLPILDAEKLRELLSGQKTPPKSVDRLELEPSEHPHKPFLQEYKLPVSTISETNSVLDNFEVDLIARKDVDCVAAVGWCLIKDTTGEAQPYIVANIGSRVALASRFRENHDHPVSFGTSDRHVEIVTGGVRNARTSLELEQRVVEALAEETGLSGNGSSPKLVMRGFRSPGFSPDCDHLFMLEIDPTRIDATKKTSHLNYTFLIKAKDVRNLVWNGECSDLLLSLAAGLVERGHSPVVPERGATLRAPLGLTLAALTGESNEGLELVREHLPNFLSTPLLRQRVRRIFEGEGQDTSATEHPEETTFFSPLLPESPKPSDGKGTVLEPRGFVLLMDHDDRHYFLGEFLPFQLTKDGCIAYDSSGTPVMQSKGVNREVIMTNEAYALYGDSQTAERMGIDDYEHLSGEPSPARIFEAVRKLHPGFSRQQELSALYTMVVKGEIPAEILHHPEYSTWRTLIRSKLLGYFVRDRPNSDLMYQFWCEHPEVGQTALNFCPRASAQAHVFRDRFEKLMRDEGELHEGFNPLKARLERLWRSEIPRVALNLSLLKSYAIKNQREECVNYVQSIDGILSRLLRTSRELGSHVAQVTSMEPTEQNLRAVAIYTEVVSELLPGLEQRYRDLSSDRNVLTEEQIQERNGKRYFLPKMPQFHITPEMEREIEQTEFANFDRAGLPRPPSMLRVVG